MNSESLLLCVFVLELQKILLVLSNFKSILKPFKTTKNSGFGHA